MEIQAASLTEKAALGQGYDVGKEEFVGRCVRGEVEFAGNQESSLNFDRSLDESSMSRQLGFEASAKARYGLFSGSLAAQFASESSSSEYSDVTVYSHTINLKNAVFRFPGNEEGLTPEGQAAKGSLEGPFVSENWPITCGHEFVSQITLGAKLLVSVRIEFSTRQQKQTFSGSFSFNGPPVEVKAALRMASERYGKRASLSIQAYQLGGDVRKLSAIFGSGEGRAPILAASLDNPDAVLDALDAVVDYSTQNFPLQIDPNMPLDSPVGPAHLAYLTSPWPELGLFAPPAIVQAGVTEARRLLNEEFETHARYQRRLSRLLNGPVRLSPRQLDRFKAMQRTVASDLARIQDAAIVCYTDFLAAPVKVAETVAQLTNFTPEEFDVEPESFAQWWDMKDLPETLIRDRDTVNGIAGILIPRFVNFDQIEDKGLALQQELPALASDGRLVLQEDQTEWLDSRVWSVMAQADVREFQILHTAHNLEPLRWLPRLEKLLVEQPVFDLAPLAELSELREIDVRGQIPSLAPLAGLDKLTVLSINGNGGAIEDLSPLAGLVNLRSLTLEKAFVRDVSPLAGLSAIERVALPGCPVATIAPLSGLPRVAEFAFGSTQTPTGGTKLLAQHPDLTSTFVRDDTILVTEDDGAESTWVRRGETNHFDTITRRPGNNGEIAGLAAFVGVGVQRFGLTIFRFVVLFHRQGEQLSLLSGAVSADGQPAGQEAVTGSTFILPNSSGETTNVTDTTPGPHWSARAA